MMRVLKRIFGIREKSENKLEERLFQTILIPQTPKDYFRWPYK